MTLGLVLQQILVAQVQFTVREEGIIGEKRHCDII